MTKRQIPQEGDNILVSHSGPSVSTLPQRSEAEEEALDKALAYLDKPAVESLPLANWQPERLKVPAREPMPTDSFRIINRRAVEQLLERIGDPNRATLTRIELMAAGLKLFWLVNSGALEPEDPAIPERCGITPNEFAQAFQSLYRNDLAGKLTAGFKLLDSLDSHPVMTLANAPAEAFKRELELTLEASPAGLEIALNAIERDQHRSGKAARTLLTEQTENFAGKKALPLVNRLLSFAEAKKYPEDIREASLVIITLTAPDKTPELFTRLLKSSVRGDSECIRDAASQALYAVCF